MSVTPVTGHGRNQILKLDNRAGTLTEIQRYCRKITHHREVENADTSAIGDKRSRRKAAIGDSSLDVDGLWNPTIDDICDAWMTFKKDYEYSPMGVGTGREKNSGTLLGSSYEIEIDFESEVTFSASGEGHSAVTRGTN